MSRRVLLGLVVSLSLPGLLAAGIAIESRRVYGVSIAGKDLGAGANVSAPMIKAGDGTFLSYDADGKSPKVTWNDTYGPHAAWTFVPRGRTCRSAGLRREVLGHSYYARAAKGPYQGWYLSRSKGGGLVLAKERSDAAPVVVFEEEVEYK